MKNSNEKVAPSRTILRLKKSAVSEAVKKELFLKSSPPAQKVPKETLNKLP